MCIVQFGSAERETDKWAGKNKSVSAVLYFLS